jgi:hypothetical protein
LIISTSQGTILTRNALIGSPEEYRNRTWSLGVSPGGYVWPELAQRVVHLRNAWDLVTMVDPAGRDRSRATIVDVPSHKPWPLSACDHSILSTTFNDELYFQLDEFKVDQGFG